ncbi:MAG: hypothetical protein LBS63_04080 [Prevotellaceae bacterium]|jgi:Holliday junction resolvase-like predicted endonuclease|nr:hypothetical protein [Prevotellaceae bacterium]
MKKDKVEPTLAPATPESILAIAQENTRGLQEIRAIHPHDMQEFRAIMRENAIAAAARSKELDAKFDAKLDKIGELVGNIGRNNGYFAEDYFFNALYASKRFAGSQYDYVSQNLHTFKGKVEDEFDIVMFNGTSVAIVETKYRVHLDFLQELTTKKVRNFRTLFPSYANHTLYLGVASMSFNDEVIAQAKQLGVGLIRAQGEAIEYDTEHVKAY